METNQSSTLLADLSNQMAQAVENISPGLVLVNARKRMPASGIIYDHELILTADHVVQREEDITIQTHDERVLTATFVARDRSTDIAVLRVANLNLDPAATASSQARVGQCALAVGRPTSHGPMASVGIISAVAGPLRTWRGPILEQYIQTDAVPYPGFSGGALIDAHGKVVGMLTTGLVRGMTLAVPMHIAVRVARTLDKQGHMKRGYLGIASQPVQLSPAQRGEFGQEHGLLIVRVEENSPAEQSGLLVGDILVKVQGTPVSDTDELHAMLRGDVVGQPVEMTIVRGGAVQQMQVTVGLRD